MRRALLVGLLCCLGLAPGLYLMSQNYIFKDKSRPFDVFLYKKAAPDTYSFESDVEGYCQLLRLPHLAEGVARGDRLVFLEGLGTMGDPKAQPITTEQNFSVGKGRDRLGRGC